MEISLEIRDSSQNAQLIYLKFVCLKLMVISNRLQSEEVIFYRSILFSASIKIIDMKNEDVAR